MTAESSVPTKRRVIIVPAKTIFGASGRVRSILPIYLIAGSEAGINLFSIF